MTKVKTKLAEKLLEMKAEYAAEMKKNGKLVMQEIFEAFFINAPEAKIVTWTQGTPSFCDGDPCRFYVHDTTVSLDEDADLDGAYESEPGWESANSDRYCDVERSTWPYTYTTTPGKEEERAARQKVDKAHDELADQLYGLNDVLEDIFGDPVRVVVRFKDGKAVFETEDYNPN